MFGGRAQNLVPNGPETEIEDGARLTVLGEDDQYLFLCGVKKGWYDTDDDMYITVYDKQKQIIAVEHEIDEDYEFRTAYLRGEDVVLLGYKYNKKTKTESYKTYKTRRVLLSIRACYDFNSGIWIFIILHSNKL